jgi:hypothetical protein
LDAVGAFGAADLGVLALSGLAVLLGDEGADDSEVVAEGLALGATEEAFAFLLSLR